MRRWFPKLNHLSLPAEIYSSSVAALYSDARSLYAGTISAALAAAVTAWKAEEPAFLACSIALAAIGVLRGRDMAAYERRSPSPNDIHEARKWEKRYIIGSGAFVAVLSLWCFLTFALTNDPVLHLISFSVSLAYLVGITGRNFSSDQLVTTQTVCAAVPMISGLLIQGSAYLMFLAALLVPFFMSLRFISTRLRKILFDAVVATYNIRALNMRFDTALNNMPHGLCMFDADQRFVVSNSRFIELLDIDPTREWRDVSMLDLLQEVELPPHASYDNRDQFIREFRNRALSSSRAPLVLEYGHQKTIELMFQPMENGGCVVLAEDTTDRRRAEAKIEHMARYDALTGLPNRTHLQNTFEKAIARRGADKNLALLFIDLDQFKKVNDTLGHPFGDELLCEVANRIRGIIDESSIVARFGGDEFVILHPLLNGKHDVANLAERIIRELSVIYEINQHQIAIGTSIGIAITPQDGVTFEDALKSADMALYRAKAEGRGTWRVFERSMEVIAKQRRALEMDIRTAITNEEFQVHFQPIIDLRSGRVAVCEALLRWHHPVRGVVSPAEFIPIAEEMGLIVELGNWAVRKACLECASWPSDVRVAVNISAIQFRRSNVCTVVQEALEAAGLPPHRLEIEITESVLLDDTEITHKALHELRKSGVWISLDDFGTGYSSLSYLHRFPLNKIKIDRSFLSGTEHDARSLILLQGIARLSADLGMSVVVEGVETHKQLALLMKEHYFSQAQGFLFSAAVPSTEIAALLNSEQIDRVNVA